MWKRGAASGSFEVEGPAGAAAEGAAAGTDERFGRFGGGCFRHGVLSSSPSPSVKLSSVSPRPGTGFSAGFQSDALPLTLASIRCIGTGTPAVFSWPAIVPSRYLISSAERPPAKRGILAGREPSAPMASYLAFSGSMGAFDALDFQERIHGSLSDSCAVA